MDTASAFIQGQLNRDNPQRVFDWLTAARLIRERQPEVAGAGLGGDWEWTGDEIYRNGHPVPADEAYTYLASTWAIPELMLDYEIIDCWIWKTDSPSWDSSTYWPDEALAILRGES